MIVSPQTVEAAKQLAERRTAIQYVPSLGRSIRPDEVVDMIADNTSPAAQRGGRELLRLMSSSSWRVVATLHTSQADQTRHITVEVSRTRYHLKLDARGCIFDITSVSGEEVQRLSGSKPWVRPGSV